MLETDNSAIRWLRPVPGQFRIYWGNGAHLYEPDFIVETAACIYMIETKMRKEMTTDEVLAKKEAAENYCEVVTEYTTANNGKPWKYVLVPHDVVDRTFSFQYILSNS